MKQWIRFLCLSLLSIVTGIASAQDVEISTVDQLKAFRDNVNSGTTYAGKTVKLTADLDLSGESNWTPIGNVNAYPGHSFNGTFDGQNHIISNVTSSDNTPDQATAGLFGSVVNGTIKNLTVKNVNITSTHYAAGIVGYTSNTPTIENCKVIGGTITSSPELVGDKYDGGNKIGGIMGYATAGSTITGCWVEGLIIKGYREVGGIVGYSNGTVSNNTVKNVTVEQDLSHDYKTPTPTTVKDLVGDGSAASNPEANGNKVVKSNPVAQIGDVKYETLAEAVAAANVNDVIEIIKAGDYTLPEISKNVTIEGKADGVVSFTHTTAGSVASISNGATFKNVTFNFGNVNYHGFQHASTINMEGCILNGKFFSYADMNFTNCQFNQSNSDYHMWCYAGNVTYSNCTFTNEKTGKFLNIYNEDGTKKYTVTVNNCKFVNQATSANKAALNVKATCGAKLLAYDVIINECTTVGAFPVAGDNCVNDYGTITGFVVNPLVQVDDRTANGVDNIKVYEKDVLIYPVNYVAKIGNKNFTSLEAAFAAAQDGATITLLKDVALTDRLFVNAGAAPAYAGSNNRYATTSENKSITLDLSGYNVTSSSNIALAGGSLNIVNNGTADAEHGVISTTNDGLAPIEIRGTGGLTQKRTMTVGTGVTLSGAVYGLNIFGSNDAQKNVIDVNVNGTVNGTLFVLGNLKNAENEININVAGTVYVPDNGDDEASVGVALNGIATVNVNEGAQVSGETGIEVRAGNLVVNGGNITATASTYSEKKNGSGSCTEGAAVAVAQHTTKLPITATLNGGTLTGTKTLVVTDVEEIGLNDVTVKAADALAKAETVVIPAGYKWVSSEGVSTLTPCDYVAQVGETKYETLADAFAAAADGNTVTLLKDVALTDRLFVNAGAAPAYAGSNNRYATTSENKSITLDLSGYNVTTSSNIALAGGSLNIVNNGTADATHGVISTSDNGLAPVEIRGTGDLASKRTLTVGENVTLKGAKYGLNIFGSNDAQKNDIEVNVNGKVEGTLFVLGNLKNTDNNVVVNVNGSVTEATGAGVSLNGFATVNVSEKAVVEGNKLGIEVRAGNLNVAGGTITSKAEEYTVSSNGSGSAATGAAISVAQHTTGLPINANITGCKLSGVKSISVADPENKNLEGVTVKVADALANVETVVIPEGYKWVSADGMSTLTKKEYVAQVGDVKYETLKEALDAAKDNENIVVELLADAVLDVTAWSGEKNALSIGSANTKTITINGNSHQLTFNNKNSDWNNIATMNDAETKLVLNNMSISNSGYNNSAWNRHDINFNCAVELNNVTSDKALAFKNDATLNNVTISDNGSNSVDDEISGVYGIWIQPNGQNISINGLTVTAERGIKIDDKYVEKTAKPVTMSIANATFNTTKKSAILVKSAANTVITAGEGINIENVVADKENLVWVDEDRAEEFYKVTVEGATIVPESKVSDYVACVMNGEQRWGFYKKLSDAVNNVEEGYSIKLHQTTTEAVEVSKPLTITKNGFTADNVTAGEGYKRFESETEIVIRSFNPICAIGDNKYETLAEAVAAAGTSEATITLLTDAATEGVICGEGVVVPSGSNITFDLNGLTYEVNGKTVGSTGTETQGFQLLQGSNITFKNGTLKATSPSAQMVIQNYSNLTLENVNIDGTGLSGWAYALSNNCGTINLTGSTSITAKEGGRAFDTCKFGDYAIPTVNINTTGVISGPIEATGGKLNIENGKFDVTWVTDSHYAAGDIQIKGGVFTAEVAEEYCAEGYIVTGNTDEATKERYPFAVKTKEEAGIYELIHDVPYKYVDGVANAEKITYTRTFEERVVGKFQTWYVPFDYTISEKDLENFKFYKIHLISAANQIGGEVTENTAIYVYVQEVGANTKLTGNRPYVIKAKNALTDFVFEVNNTKLYAKDNSSRLHVETTDFNYDFYGNYDDYSGAPQYTWYSLNKSGQLQGNSSTATLRSYHWYIKATARGENADYAKPNFFIVEGDGETDGINNAQTTEAEIEGIYTLGGIKVEHLVKGVNIIKYTDGRTKKINVK